MIRKYLMLVLTSILLIAYMLITDPYADVSLMNDIPYGIALVFLLKAFLLIGVLISLLHITTDYQLDRSYGVDEKELVDVAKNDPVAASNIMLSRSIRYVASAIVILAVLLFLR